MRDARNDTCKQPSVRCHTGRITDNGPKSQRVQAELRPRTHRENVADDSTDAGRGSLEWFDRAWVIMRFDLERDRPAVSNIDHAGVLFTGPDQNPRVAGGELS